MVNIGLASRVAPQSLALMKLPIQVMKHLQANNQAQRPPMTLQYDLIIFS